MNVVISDTAEYGNYLFANAAVPLLKEHIMPKVGTDVIGKGLSVKDNGVDNVVLVQVNEAIRNHPIEQVGKVLRGYMKDMKRIAVGG
jgi:ketol-acid reductoisomerase